LEVLYKEVLAGADAEAYDAFVDSAAGGHAAQARAWADVATAGRPLLPRFFLARERGDVVGAALVLRASAGKIPAPAAIVERGPVCARTGDVGRVVEALARATRRHGVARLSVMPYWAGDDARAVEGELAKVRFRSVQELDGAHALTLRVDLAGKTDAEVFAGKEREVLRRKLRQAEKAGAAARRGARADVPTLERLHQELMAAQGKRPKPRAWFDALGASILAHDGPGARGAVFVCEDGASANEPLAALFVSRHGAVATFVLGAASSAPRSYSKMAPAMAAAIRWARDEGCATFDLGGVPMDGDDDPKRAQIAQFKLDFAKTRVPLVGEHARWF